MLLLNPRLVTFNTIRWDDVALILIDRAANREVVEWSDLGAHVVLADVAEQRIEIRILQELTRDDITVPRPGESGELVLHTAPASTDAGRKEISTEAVILRVTHELSLKRGALRTITLIAISEDGAEDPFSITDDEGGGAE
jgi:hypothetical protein